MAIQTDIITTNQGYLTGNIPQYLSDDEIICLNCIGHSGKDLDGYKTNRVDYLNSLGKGEFSIEKTKFDNGDFREEFIITRGREVQKTEFNTTITTEMLKALYDRASEYAVIAEDNVNKNEPDTISIDEDGTINAQFEYYGGGVTDIENHYFSVEDLNDNLDVIRTKRLKEKEIERIASQARIERENKKREEIAVRSRRDKYEELKREFEK